MRLFVGVELDDQQRTACAAAGRKLESRLAGLRKRPSIRWIPAENLHITLWFLGETTDERTGAIADALRADWKVPAFSLTVAGAGAFPPTGAARIIWIGVSGGSDRLVDLHNELATRLPPLGFSPERRPYHPHITIGRVKDADSAASRRMREVFQKTAVNGGTSQVRTVTLFQSRLSPYGARYEPILRVPLKGC